MTTYIEQKLNEYELMLEKKRDNMRKEHKRKNKKPPKLLELISEVDPFDIESIQDIDFSFLEFQNQQTYEEKRDKNCRHCYIDESFDSNALIIVPNVSKSRDLLKCARPEGWIMCKISHLDTGIISVTLRKGLTSTFVIGSGKTEELAELYAVIQAIRVERGETL